MKTRIVLSQSFLALMSVLFVGGCMCLNPWRKANVCYVSPVFPVRINLSWADRIVVVTGTNCKEGLTLRPLHIWIAPRMIGGAFQKDVLAIGYQAGMDFAEIVTAYQFAYFISPHRPASYRTLDGKTLDVTTVVLCKLPGDRKDIIDWTEWSLSQGYSIYFRAHGPAPCNLNKKYLAAELKAREQRKGLWARPKGIDWVKNLEKAIANEN